MTASRWIHYFLSQEALGPTVGVPYDYVAPASAFVPWKVPKAVNGSWVNDGNRLVLTPNEVRQLSFQLDPSSRKFASNHSD